MIALGQSLLLTVGSCSAVPQVQSGADRLHAQDHGAKSILTNRRVGLITNHTGKTAQGETTIDLLHNDPEIRLVRLFCPEHGIRGRAENGVEITDGLDTKTGLPIVSLYGATRRPLPKHLEGLDVLVFDIQDIGARFYTYISTMGLAMEVAAEAGIAFVVLDRPNPIGNRVEGPLPDGKLSFVCPHSIPIRHGMTVGELARMFKAERKLANLDLRVIKMTGYERTMWFDQTGLPWTAPSPNMPDIEAATLYPGIGILEFLELSVGRGTDSPFRIVGAPYLDGAALATDLADRGVLAGVAIEVIEFRPTKSKFAEKTCYGIQLKITDRDRCQPLKIGIAIGAHLARHHPKQSDFDRKIGILLKHPETAAAMKAGNPLPSTWDTDTASFANRRAPFLLYPQATE